MVTTVFCATRLKFDLEEKPEEAIVHCHGRITAESAESFQSEVRGHTIPASRGKGVATIGRIILDLSNVTHIDNDGLRALFEIWTAGQQKSCSVEVINLGRSAGKLPALARLDHLWTRMRATLSR